MVTLKKDLGTFSAAHQLPTHNGKCKNLHGHEYHVEVEVEGDLEMSGPGTGMVVDFGILKDIYKEEIFSQVDHALLIGKIPLPWMLEIPKIEDILFSKEGCDEEVAAELAFRGYGKVAFIPVEVTTAELMAQWMVGLFKRGLRVQGIRTVDIVRVTVYETPTSSATAEVTI